MPTRPSKQLETFDNPHPERDYIIEIETPEFTCLCPKTGQPDFASITLQYVPDEKCVELKSLKLYYWSYRDEGAFHEKVTNTILDDLVQATSPRYMLVTAVFNVRGGIYTTVHAEYRKPGWQPIPPRPDHLEKEVQILPTERETPTSTTTSAVSGPRAAAHGTSGPAGSTPEATPENNTALPAAGLVEEIVAPPPPKSGRDRPVYLGLDIGTTGCRIVAIDAQGTLLNQAQAPLPAPSRRDQEVTQDADHWWQAASTCLDNIFQSVDPRQIHSIAIDGTSGTLLAIDGSGNPLAPALMYNDSRAQEQASIINDIAPGNSGAHGATSSLAKLLWLQGQSLEQQAAHVLHQSDWLTGRLTGQWGVSDHNNAMKLGYDPVSGEWPIWLDDLKVNRALLPRVVAPGDLVGTLSSEIAMSFGMPEDTRVVGGTTDGVAAFLAAGATEPGHAVTSLGTTLVLKLLSETPVFAPEYGVYSHRLGRYWLAGGASNSGGAVLLQYFKVDQMREMTAMLDPDNLTGLDYYPLPAVGERFPVNDPEMVARLEPLPGDSVVFFQAILEGIANIEARGYQLLTELGAPPVTEIRTTGGGSQNAAWEKIRGKITGAKMVKARSELAAYGAALLAKGVVEENFS